MEAKQRLYRNIYDKLYWKYKDNNQPKLALFVRKFFLEGITDTKSLKEELGLGSDRTIRYRKAVVNKDLLLLAKTTKDVPIPDNLTTGL
ncbi:MAG: hypothetical protein LBG59_07815 [Candidatus Peribacteria bacterium]|jgi:hypothetical protein|nr:hypothetical protein [Candidatus Peribacteria bacterium]